MKKIICFIILSAMILCFSGCSNGFYDISANDIEKVCIENIEFEQKGAKNVSSEYFGKIVELYNNSEYKGKATGNGGTPQFLLSVHLKNGKWISINEFYDGKTLEVLSNGKQFYLENKELYSFIYELSQNTEF